MFIVEFNTTTGKVCEGYATYEEARQRVEQFPAAALLGIPLIFEELADGSQRFVRDDGKPLQVHRLSVQELPPGPDEPVALADESSGLLDPGRWVVRERPSPQDDGLDDEPPLPLSP